jgi:LPS sulfotransferase NodH
MNPAQATAERERATPCLDSRFPGVKTNYIIASMVRTGSYLLCDALAAAGMGDPGEAFCPVHRGRYGERWKLSPDLPFGDYFTAVVNNSTTPNGVFGVKIHQNHVEPLARECGTDAGDVLAELFPTARYVHLSRRDRRAQAISLLRANQTNEWWRRKGEPNAFARDVQPVLDPEAILGIEEQLFEQNAAWEWFFQAHGITPCRVEYEALDTDYQATVARVLEFLGQDPRAAEHLPEPRYVRQRDATTDAWIQSMDRRFPRK